MIATMAVVVPPGWPEIGVGLGLIAFTGLIYLVNRMAGRLLGTSDRFKRSQLIGAGFLAALGVLSIGAGVVHLL